jgi:4-hydroxy-tetrahydrodipicolinate reductase
MMKIALIGYGKMGKAIEEVAVAKGHNIVLKADVGGIDTDLLQLGDVAIEFTEPGSVINNIRTCLDYKIPVVVGTTGWYSQYDEIKTEAIEKGSAILTATNFSIGVNLFFRLNESLAVLMNSQQNYNVFLEETHHSQKLDAPSGTAITLAEGVLKNVDRKKNWVGQMGGNEKPVSSFDLVIISNREDDIPGTHIVKYVSDMDEIEIIHTAKSRKGFAAGAVAAAEWLKGRKGIFTMNDVLGF